MKISNLILFINRIVVLIGMLFSQNLSYSQSKPHDAGYYFALANTMTKVAPDHYNDSLIRSCILLYSKAIQLKPTFSQAYRNRGRLYGDLKFYKNAIADLTRAIKYCRDDDRWSLRGMRGEYYYLNGEYARAIKDYDFAIPGDGNPSYFYLIRAKSYWKSGFKDKACRDYLNAVKFDPAVAKNKEFLDCNR